MNNRTVALGVFMLLCVACVAHALYYYPRLPAQVARHFGESGQPNAWCSKMQFLVLYVGTVSVMVLTFLGIGLALPKLPDWALNIPRKDYWLAPERRQPTVARVATSLLWLGSLNMVLLLDIFHQSFQVHLGIAAALNHIGISVAAYLIVSTVWCLRICLTFGKKECPPTKGNVVL